MVISTANAIQGAGGPYPAIGEARSQYNLRVSQWANSRGYNIVYDGNGQPYVTVPTGGGGGGPMPVTPAPLPMTIAPPPVNGNGVVAAVQTGDPVPDPVINYDMPPWLTALIGGVGGLLVGGVPGALLGAGGGAISAVAQGSLTAEATGSGSGYLSGLGLPEPQPGTFSKTWTTLYERKDGKNVRVYFWLMNDGYVISYDSDTKRSKRWKPKKPVAVIMGGGKMSMQDFLKADRYLDRFTRRLAKRSKRLKLQ